MKRTLIVFCCAAVLAACGNNKESKTSETSGTTTETTEKSDPEAEKGLNLVAKNDCFTCHKIAEKFTGPAYTEVAEKYAGQESAMIDSLAHKVIHGGSGVWGAVPMTPHPTVSVDDAKAMVHYVLSLKK